MKVNYDYETQVFGNVDVKDVHIAATPIMFDILSSKIYSDKIAVVRELCTNAIDEHNECGKEDVPIHVHLPTEFEPYFEVKDFGRGMSPEKIHKTYLTYGASDKHDSNRSVGCLGLGSKVGFIENDQFTTITRYDGKVYEWLVFRGADGMVKVTLTLERPATEEDDFGTIVRVPVSGDKLSTYRTYVSKCAKSWPVKPVVVPEMELTDYDLAHKNEYGAICGDFNGYSSYPRIAEVKVHMGLVTYDLSKEHLEEIVREFPHASIYKSWIKWCKGILLFAKMDDEERRIDFAVSREHVEWTEQSKKAIRFLLTNFIDKLNVEFYREFNQLSSLIEKIHYMNRQHASGVTNDISYRINRRDYRIKYQIPIPTIRTFFDKDIVRSTVCRVYRYDLYDLYDNSRPQQNPLIGSALHSIFVYRDVKTGWRKRYEKLCVEYRKSARRNLHIIEIVPTHKSFTYERAKKFYGSQLIAASSIELPTPSRRSKSSKKKEVTLTIFECRDREMNAEMHWKGIKNIPLDDVHQYFEPNKIYVRIPMHRWEHCCNFKPIMRNASNRRNLERYTCIQFVGYRKATTSAKALEVLEQYTIDPDELAKRIMDEFNEYRPYIEFILYMKPFFASEDAKINNIKQLQDDRIATLKSVERFYKKCVKKCSSMKYLPSPINDDLWGPIQFWSTLFSYDFNYQTKFATICKSLRKDFSLMFVEFEHNYPPIEEIISFYNWRIGQKMKK